MTEREYFGHLEYRICGEMLRIETCRRLGLWCDGLGSRDQDLGGRPLREVVGHVWIGIGPSEQEMWEFTLKLQEPVRSQAEVDWSSHLPAEDAEGWLSVDLGKRHLEIEPTARHTRPSN